MGYTTEFKGEFKLDRPLTQEHLAYLAKFNEQRHMKRNAAITATLPDPVRKAVGLDVGPQGDYFVGDDDPASAGVSEGIVDYNEPPDDQPSLWCQWMPNEDGTAIVWDGAEKFYEYRDWLLYIIDNFLEPWGYVLNGDVVWQGEDYDDVGLLAVRNNQLL